MSSTSISARVEGREWRRKKNAKIWSQENKKNIFAGLECCTILWFRVSNLQKYSKMNEMSLISFLWCDRSYSKYILNWVIISHNYSISWILDHVGIFKCRSIEAISIVYHQLKSFNIHQKTTYNINLKFSIKMEVETLAWDLHNWIWLFKVQISLYFLMISDFSCQKEGVKIEQIELIHRVQALANHNWTN